MHINDLYRKQDILLNINMKSKPRRPMRYYKNRELLWYKKTVIYIIIYSFLWTYYMYVYFEIKAFYFNYTGTRLTLTYHII